MFALVQDGSITKMLSGRRGLTIGENQYPGSIFTVWSESDRNAIGIYKVIWDNTNKKNQEWYINGAVSYSFADGKVTASYASATAKPHADTTWTQADSDNGLLPANKSVGDVKSEGLKTQLIRMVKGQAEGELKRTDWYIIRKADAGTSVPSAITNHRAAVRTKCAEMETSITNASNTAALETLYTYVNTADEGDPVVMERPIGRIPRLET